MFLTNQNHDRRPQVVAKEEGGNSMGPGMDYIIISPWEEGRVRGRVGWSKLPKALKSKLECF